MQYFEIAAGLLAPLIAVIVAYIAYQQYRVNRNRLRLDLFEKRWQVHEALMGLFGHVLQTASASDEALFAYLERVKVGRFLFDDAIWKFLYEVHTKASQLQELKRQLKDLPVGESRTKVAREAHDIGRWMKKERGAASSRFDRYLRFE